MATISEWKSSTEFDEELSKIDHYRKNHHPEMTPFIGSHYKESRILLVGESHFYEYEKGNNAEKEKKYLNESWYVKPTPNGFSCKNNFNTREVIHNFLTRKRTKSHSMFRNPAKCVANVYKLENVSDSEAFNTFAFMNYFQKPALEAHKSINNNIEDNQVAFNTLISVCKVIKPEKVVFLSNKAYKCYNSVSALRKEILPTPVDLVYHPTSPYWNGKDGKEKFENILEKDKKQINFSRYEYYSNDKIKSAVQDMGKYIGCRAKRFRKDKTTIRIYEKSNGVYEFAAHMLAGENKVGIGYNIEIQSIWIWDYFNKRYISESDINNYIGLSELYSSFCKVIEEL